MGCYVGEPLRRRTHVVLPAPTPTTPLDVAAVVATTVVATAAVVVAAAVVAVVTAMNVGCVIRECVDVEKVY